jgi:hypothetical protein
MLYSYPRQNFGSTSPLFSRYTCYKEECVSGEQQGVMPKPCLGQERTMETNPSTHPWAVQKYGQSETDTVADMQRPAYLQPYLFRTGDA